MSDRDALIAGRYRVVNRIGSGGMGIVWQGWDERLQRPVALKQLHTQPGLSEAEAQMANDRAMREARITARLHHPHAVPVFDVVEHDGRPCLVMQYFPSTSLHTVLDERGPLPPTEVARVGAEVASALAAAHRAGIVHRDVKPGNVLLAEDGSAKISDFGISHALGDLTLTSTGMVTGTPAYLAPEVARGAESSFASDVFSLGATLYAAVEGAPPFGTHPNPMALLHHVASGQVAPLKHGGALTPLLLRMLAASPQDRPRMNEVAAALYRVDADPSATVQDLPAVTVAGPATAAPLTESDWPDAEPAPRRSRAGLAVVSAAIVLVLAMVVVFLLFGRDGVPSSADQPSMARTSSSASTPAATSPAPPPASATTAGTAASSSPTTAGAPTAAQFAQAITDYYGLLPGNTDAGWSRLTARYQTTTARNRQTYQAFWAAVQRVSASNATGSPAGTVQASITYSFKDGRVVQERTSFGMVGEGGILKIDSSTVLSSQPR